jgi:hypothetical protein
MMAAATLISNARAMLVLAGMAFAVPAIADEANQITIYGEVAPRCWVAHPIKVTATNAMVQVTPARAICNQARPVLASEVRMIGSDGVLIKRGSATAERPVSFSTRTALEIVVTPQL